MNPTTPRLAALALLLAACTAPAPTPPTAAPVPAAEPAPAEPAAEPAATEGTPDTPAVDDGCVAAAPEVGALDSGSPTYQSVSQAVTPRNITQTAVLETGQTVVAKPEAGTTRVVLSYDIAL